MEEHVCQEREDHGQDKTDTLDFQVTFLAKVCHPKFVSLLHQTSQSFWFIVGIVNHNLSQ